MCQTRIMQVHSWTGQPQVHMVVEVSHGGYTGILLSRTCRGPGWVLVQLPRLRPGQRQDSSSWLKQMEIPGAKADEIYKGFLATVDSFFSGKKSLSLFVQRVTVDHNASCCVGAIRSPAFLPCSKTSRFCQPGWSKMELGSQWGALRGLVSWSLTLLSFLSL